MDLSPDPSVFLTLFSSSLTDDDSQVVSGAAVSALPNQYNCMITATDTVSVRKWRRIQIFPVIWQC